VALLRGDGVHALVPLPDVAREEAAVRYRLSLDVMGVPEEGEGVHIYRDTRMFVPSDDIAMALDAMRDALVKLVKEAKHAERT
jgi:hypothetical protein